MTVKSLRVLIKEHLRLVHEIADKIKAASTLIPGLNVCHLGRQSVLKIFVKQDICSPYSHTRQLTERKEKILQRLIESNGTSIPDRARYKYIKKYVVPYDSDDDSNEESDEDNIKNLDT